MNAHCFHYYLIRLELQHAKTKYYKRRSERVNMFVYRTYKMKGRDIIMVQCQTTGANAYFSY